MIIHSLLLLIICAILCISDINVESVTEYNTALGFHRSGDVASAILHYTMAIQLTNDFPEAHQNVGLLYELIGDFPRSTYHHQQSVLHAHTPEMKSASIVNLVLIAMKANTALTNEEYEKLVILLSEAQALTPEDVNVDFTIGIIRDLMGHSDLALHSFQRILSINPQHSLALLNIGNYYFKLSQFRQASQYYEESLAVSNLNTNNLIFALNNLGQSYREQGRLNDAFKSFLQGATHFNKDFNSQNEKIRSSLHFYSLNNVLTIQGLLSKWKDMELLEHSIEEFVTISSTGSPEIQLNSELTLSKLVCPYSMSLLKYGDLKFDAIAAKTACPMSPLYTHTLPDFSQTEGRKVLKVGYLSFDWRNHPMGRLTSHLVTSHNKSIIDSYSFSYGANDGSSVRKHVRANSPHFIELALTQNDYDAAAIVYSNQLDILVDITTHTYNGRIAIASVKPAPIVINYLGLPGSSGCSGFDYSMVDSIAVPPESASGFTEKLIYLPYSYQANDMPLSVAPCKSRMECRHERQLITDESYKHHVTRKRVPLLLKKHKKKNVQWICSFNANKKIEPTVFATWMNILIRVPTAILIMLDIPADARKQLLLMMAFHGVSKSRILFVPNQEWQHHLYRVAACDIVLDTFVYGAHTTSTDVLWMNVPILMLRSYGSGRMPSRVAGSIMSSLTSNAMNILIADSVAEYEEIAVKLLKNMKILEKLHVIIGEHSLNAPTFDKDLMQINIETVYQSVHETNLLRESISSPHIFLPTLPKSQSLSGILAKRQLIEALSDIHQSLTTQYDMSHCSEVSDLQHLWYCISIDLNVSTLSGDVKSSMQSSAGITRRLLLSYADDAESTIWRNIEEKFEFLFEVSEEITVIANPLACSIVFNVESLVKDIQLHSVDTIDDLNIFKENLFDAMADNSMSNLTESLLIILDAQALLNHDCIAEQLLFEVVGKLFLRICLADELNSQNEFLNEILRELKELFVDISVPYYCPVNEDQPELIKLILSHILSNHALCLDKNIASVDLTRVASFIGVTMSHQAINFNWEAQRNVGLRVMMDVVQGPYASRLIEFGYKMTSNAILALHKASFIEHEKAIYREGRRTIVFYCDEYGQSWFPGWGPSSIREGKGLGGSEEAVYQTAIELAALGFTVTIFSGLPNEDIGVVTHNHTESGGSILWLHYKNLDVTKSCDVFIAWRYAHSLIFGRLMAKQTYLWLHDLVSGPTLPLSIFTECDGVLVQSLFHKQFIMNEVNKYQNCNITDTITGKIFVLHNGITIPTEEFASSPLINDNNLFIYGSSPSRGLYYVLQEWKTIKESIPNAQLEVYYGFTDAVVAHMKETRGEEGFNIMYSRMMELMKQDGIHYFGSVDPNTLLQAYQRAGFWLYPTNFQETGCITGIKAMVSGCIPITSRLQESVLIELTDRYDLGPYSPLNISVASNASQMNTWLKEWTASIIRAYNTNNDLLMSHRAIMRYEVLLEYTWKNTAGKLAKLFNLE